MPRTWNPRSRRALTTHAAIKPDAPVTRTLLPGATTGILEGMGREGFQGLNGPCLVPLYDIGVRAEIFLGWWRFVALSVCCHTTIKQKTDVKRGIHKCGLEYIHHIFAITHPDKVWRHEANSGTGSIVSVILLAACFMNSSSTSSQRSPLAPPVTSHPTLVTVHKPRISLPSTTITHVAVFAIRPLGMPAASPWADSHAARIIAREQLPGCGTGSTTAPVSACGAGPRPCAPTSR